MTDIIRMARAIYGPAYDQMNEDATRIKNEYMDAGGDPWHVISPERLKALATGGLHGLLDRPTKQRQDGSVEGPYVPTPIALATNMIEKRAIPAVVAATNAGIHTVSSGVNPDTGAGFAIGRAPSGHVVRVEK